MGNALMMQHSQQLVMGRQLQQALRMLQLSSQELDQEIEDTLNSNVFLEREEREMEDGQASQDEVPTGIEQSSQPIEEELPVHPSDAGYEDYIQYDTDNDSGDEDTDPCSYTAAHKSLREHLLEQIGTSGLSAESRVLATIIAGNLDDDGYFRQSLEDLLGHLKSSSDGEWDAEWPTVEDMSVALRFVQSLDPVGVGARSVAECLELQLLAATTSTPASLLALRVVREHLPLLAMHDSIRLTRLLDCDEAALKAANGLILNLDPRPGDKFEKSRLDYVVADVIVKKTGGRWVASINAEVLPRLKVNPMYAQAAQGQRIPLASALGAQYQEARWLIRNVQQRFQTIQRVAQVVVDKQVGFFEHGDFAMKPLILSDVARILGMHESTVSRATSNKFMATKRGLFEFKHFFRSQVVANDGHVWSSTAIRAMIRELVSSEKAEAPLSDIRLARMLGAGGVNVARRTVTKYRDAMRIPPVAARRMATVD